MEFPDNCDPDQLYPIPDLSSVAEVIRKEGIKEFNNRFAADYLHIHPGLTKSGKKKRWSTGALEDVFPLHLVTEIMVATLPFVQERNQHCINARFFAECIEKVAKALFYHICNKLVDAGILELIFNSEANDFAYRFVEKKI
jgi:hypothetical protein